MLFLNLWNGFRAEGLYCKRPIQCLASSEILIPTPSTPGERVLLPRLLSAGTLSLKNRFFAPPPPHWSKYWRTLRPKFRKISRKKPNNISIRFLWPFSNHRKGHHWPVEPLGKIVQLFLYRWVPRERDDRQRSARIFASCQLYTEHIVYKARICKRLWSPGIDSASLCSLTGRYDKYVVAPARQAGNRFLGSLKGLQIRAQNIRFVNPPPPPPPLS